MSVEVKDRDNEAMKLKEANKKLTSQLDDLQKQFKALNLADTAEVED